MNKYSIPQRGIKRKPFSGQLPDMDTKGNWLRFGDVANDVLRELKRKIESNIPGSGDRE